MLEKQVSVKRIIIVLRDRRAGGYSFCNPRESNFIPRGEAPRDEIRLPIGDHAIVLLLSLLNKKSARKETK